MSTNDRTHQSDQQNTTKQQQVQPVSEGPELLQAQSHPSLALQRVMGAPPPAINPSDVLTLQRTIGNRAVQELLTQRTADPLPATGAQIARKTDTATPANSYHRIAGDITGVFEGGKADTYQNKDSGIISYGKHQATLSSGSLGKVLTRYIELSDSDTSKKIEGYMDKVNGDKSAKESLRDDATFKTLLTSAATESEMAQAQEDIFSANYWNPAKKSAEKNNVTSALGHAIFYDTIIQGGHEDVLKRAQKKLEGKEYTEQEFLKAYLEERKERLLEVAKKKRDKGDETTAKYLESSADYRISALMALVDAGNLNLQGEVKIRKQKITSLTEGATVDDAPGGSTATTPVPGLPPTPPPPSTPTAQNGAPIGTATVTATKLNVRQEASTTAGKLGALTQGQRADVLDHKGEWLKISFKDGTGFISAAHATYTPNAAPTAKKAAQAPGLWEQAGSYLSEKWGKTKKAAGAMVDTVEDWMFGD